MTQYHESGVQRFLTAIAHGQGRKLREKLRTLYGWTRRPLYGATDGTRLGTYVVQKALSIGGLIERSRLGTDENDERGEDCLPLWLVPYLSHRIDNEIDANDLTRLTTETRKKLLLVKRRNHHRMMVVFDGWCSGMTQADMARELRISREAVRLIANFLLRTPAMKELLAVLTKHHHFYGKLWKRKQHELR